jgi:hypothetical protein
MGSAHGRRYGRLGVVLLMGALLLVVDVTSSATRSASIAPAAYNWPTVDAAPLLKWSAIAAVVVLPAWLAVTRGWSFRARAAVVAWILLVPAVLLAVSLLGPSNVPPGHIAQPAVTGQPHPSSLPAPARTPPSASEAGSGTSSVSMAGRYSLLIAGGLALAAAVAMVIVLLGGRELEEGQREETPLGDRLPPVALPPAEPRDPREAVIRNYREMEIALAAHGHPRPPWETSAEYAATAASAVTIAKPAAERLTSLFELARYSPHVIDQGARNEADGSLADILADLHRPKGPDVAGDGA